MRDTQTNKWKNEQTDTTCNAAC